MWKQLVWTTPTSGPYRPGLGGAHQLWDYIAPAPVWPHSLLIADDGTVTERSSPTNDETLAARRHIKGGSDLRLEDTDQDYLDLVAAGYTFRDVEGPR
jgi:hypothetical protein